MTLASSALAIRYRPASFKDVLGQDHITDPLTHAFERKKTHPAYLLTGTRGVGKTTLARIIAKAINCAKGISGAPCLTCTHCTSIATGQHVDCIEIDAASKTKVEDTRELLEQVQYSPSLGAHKIIIIDEVHMLSQHSFNALLKTLEEPPAHVLFILATTDPQKIPETIRSRCLPFHLKNISKEAIAQRISYILDQENITYEQEALTYIAHAGQGSMRDALTLLDQLIMHAPTIIDLNFVHQKLGHISDNQMDTLIYTLANQTYPEMIQHLHKLLEQGIPAESILSQWMEALHKVAGIQFTGSTNAPDAYLALANAIPRTLTLLWYDLLQKQKHTIGWAPTTHIALDMCVYQCMAFDQRIPEQPNSSQTNPPEKKANQQPPPCIETPPEPTSHTATNTPAQHPAWEEIINLLKLSGMTQQLALHCVFVSLDKNKLILHIEPQYQALASKVNIEKLTSSCQSYYQNPKLSITLETSDNIRSPAQQKKENQNHKDMENMEKLKNHPNTQKFLKTLNATIIED